MGAYFALSSRTAGNVFYQTPALLASAFSVADLLFIWVMMPETLTKDVKVGNESSLNRILLFGGCKKEPLMFDLALCACLLLGRKHYLPHAAPGSN